MEELHMAFILCTHGRCWERALALTHRRICKKSQKSPVLIAISEGNIYSWKAECAMICHLSKFYMAMKIDRCCRVNTLPLHIVDAKHIEKWTVFKRHFRWRYQRYQRIENTMTCHSSRAFILYSFRFCALKTLREDTHIKEEKHQNYPSSDAISDEDINHIQTLRV